MVKQIPRGATAKKFTITRKIIVVSKNGSRYFTPEVKAFPMT